MIVHAEKNPIISKRGVCDPHIHIFNDRAYLYASHDSPDGNHDYDMFDWEIWSSSDLIDWRRESVIRPEETSIGPTYQCWAPDAAEKDGKYYLYLSFGMNATYVLASDCPGNGFTDVMKAPLLPKGLTPTASYDPAVFADDDGKCYILFGTPNWAGGDSYYIARLGDDMMSLAETPRKITLDDSADDKPFLHKHGGVYYLSWGSYYATSENVYGPYTTRGNLDLTYDHSSFFEWNGQWFMAFTVTERIVKQRRATGIAYIHYCANGDMRADQLIREYGVGQYDGGWNRIEAEWFMKGVNVEKRENTFGGFDVAMHSGSSLEFPNIRSLPDNPWLVVNGVSWEDVDIEVYEGNVLLAVCRKPASFMKGGEFTKYNEGVVRLPLSAGTHSLRFVARGSLLLDCFRFLTE